MKAKIQDKEKCGIYLIRNLINGKVYIGKSTDIYRRIVSHISSLNLEKLSNENEHLINSWKKYGKELFEYIILEECSFELLKEKELFYIQKYNSLDRNFGYNFRLDSESGMIPLESTRNKYSIAQKKRFENKEEREKISRTFKLFWENNPEIKERMRKKVKEARLKKYKFIQLDREENIIEIFNSVEDIIRKYPHFKWQNIYAVCNGYKPTIYGYKWKKELKI